MFKMWIEIILFLFLGLCALWDGMKKEIPLIVVWLGMITAVLLHGAGLMEKETWFTLGIALLPGAVFWGIGFMTREKVGYGDGWVLAMIGLFVGFSQCLLILMIGLVIESVVLLVLLVFHKIQKDGKVPFVPFLLLGLGVVACF